MTTAKLAITRELKLCERTLRGTQVLTSEELAELRGIQQALAWALDARSAMRPMKAAAYASLIKRVQSSGRKATDA
jgi:transposase